MPDYPERFVINEPLRADKINHLLNTVMAARNMQGVNGSRVTNNFGGMQVSQNTPVNPGSLGNTTVTGCNLSLTETIPYLSVVAIEGTIDWAEDEIEKPLVFSVENQNDEVEVYGIAKSLIEPDGGTGSVVISGVTHAIIKGTPTGFASVDADEDFLVYSSSGRFPVIWSSEDPIDGESDLYLAVVALGTGGGNSGEVPRVGKLPAIPDTGKKEVRWDSSISPFTGDNQNWMCMAGDTKWTPLQRSTDNDGTPTP